MSKRPHFTREQEDWICYQIGDWYLEWKNRIIVDGEKGTHRLGYAKELLKTMICGDGSVEYEYQSCIVRLYTVDEQFRFAVVYSPLNIIIKNSLELYDHAEMAIEEAKKFIQTLEY